MAEILNDSNMQGMHVKEKLFSDVNYRLGNFDEAIFEGCQFRHVEFEGVWINDIVFKNCSFSNCLFYAVQGFGAVFEQTAIKDTAFHGCNLAESSFIKSSIMCSKFLVDKLELPTDFSGAVFTEVILDNVVFKGAVYNSLSVFPNCVSLDDFKGSM